MRSDWRLAAAAIVVSGLVGSTGATPALAQGRPGAGSPASDKARKDGARKEYKEGERLLKLGRYKDAFEHYRTADDLLPIAATKYKMAVCLDRQGKILESATSYQVFLDAAPPDKLADAIADARARLEVLRRTPGKIRIAVDPPGLTRLGLQVDGGPVYAPPPDRTLTVPPGHHRITATAAGYDATSAELDLGFGENRELRLTLNVSGRAAAPALPAPVAALGVQPPPPAAGAPAPPPQAGVYQGPQGTPSRVPAYVLLGVAGAGAVVGAVFGVQALGAKSDFNKPHAHTVANADREQRDARIADIALFSALGLAVVGTVLLFVPRSPPDTAVAAGPRGFVAPYVGPTGGGAAGVITF